MSAGARVAILATIALLLFVISVIVLLQVVPGPHSATDYLIIGCLGTLIALVALFILVIATWVKPAELFFRRRKR